MLPFARRFRPIASGLSSLVVSSVCLVIALRGVPALAQAAAGTMTCKLSSTTAAPESTVTLDLFLQNVSDVRGYQATIAIT